MEESRSRTHTVVLWSAVVAVVALAIAGVIGLLTGAYHIGRIGDEMRVQINEHRSFPVTGVQELNVASVGEPIRITEAPDTQFAVHFTGSVATTDRSGVPQLEAAVNGTTLKVRVKHRPFGITGFHRDDLVLEVAVPTRYAGVLAAEAVSGRINIVPHTFQSLSAKTTSGAISLMAARAASVALRSVSGAVSAHGVSADRVSVDTTSGRIDLEAFAPEFKLHSVSGAIRAEASAKPKTINIESTSGAVSLRLPADSQFALDAASTSGEVLCDFPITLSGSAAGGRRLLGEIGGRSSGRVTIRTISGSIGVTR